MFLFDLNTHEVYGSLNSIFQLVNIGIVVHLWSLGPVFVWNLWDADGKMGVQCARMLLERKWKRNGECLGEL